MAQSILAINHGCCHGMSASLVSRVLSSSIIPPGPAIRLIAVSAPVATHHRELSGDVGGLLSQPRYVIMCCITTLGARLCVGTIFPRPMKGGSAILGWPNVSD